MAFLAIPSSVLLSIICKFQLLDDALVRLLQDKNDLSSTLCQRELHLSVTYSPYLSHLCQYSVFSSLQLLVLVLVLV